MLKQLDAIMAEINGVLEAKDLECIHRMRVASRRLRAAQALFDDCLPRRRITPWEKEIRKITRSLGLARDLDIQIETIRRFRLTVTDPQCQPGANRLILRLLQQRALAQKKVSRTVSNFNGSAIIRLVRSNLQQYIPDEDATKTSSDISTALNKLAADAIIQKMDELIAFDEIADFPDKKTELHAMRIAAKRFRYTLEIFAPLYSGGLKTWIKSIKEIQEQLGNLHDCDVWIDFLPVFLKDEEELTRQYYGNLRGFRRILPGLDVFKLNREAARQRFFNDFHSVWAHMRSANSLHRLRSKILRSTSPAREDDISPDESDVEPIDAMNKSPTTMVIPVSEK